MDRRDFLRSAGTTAASGYLLAATAGAAVAADRPQWNVHWRSYLSNPDTHPRIPNVSYAGYRRGELPLPRPGVRASVTAFGAVGDGVTDRTAAFDAAVERVGADGGGTVHVPPGTYLLTGVVWVHHSREGFSSGNVWSNGTMEGTFDSHRALPFESVRTAITVTNNGTTGGAGDAGPRWGARFCHWNVDVLGGRSHGVRLEEHAPYSAVVGVRGTAGPTDHPEDFTGELSSVVDALDEAVLPVNLYEAQLRHRLRGPTQERCDA